jgi:hypothetical protein
VSRKGAVVRVKVRVPGVRPGDPRNERRQPSYDSIDNEGNLVFVVELGYKATLFIIILASQFFYTFFDPIMEALGYLHP